MCSSGSGPCTQGCNCVNEVKGVLQMKHIELHVSKHWIVDAWILLMVVYWEDVAPVSYYINCPMKCKSQLGLKVFELDIDVWNEAGMPSLCRVVTQSRGQCPFGNGLKGMMVSSHKFGAN